MAGLSPPTTLLPPREPLADFARAACACGGRRHCRRRMLPTNRWTFDVTLRRGSVETYLGRWTFGRYLGQERAAAHALRALGHAGECQFLPVGWPGPDYSRHLIEVWNDIEEGAAAGRPAALTDDRTVRGGPGPDRAALEGELPFGGLPAHVPHSSFAG